MKGILFKIERFILKSIRKLFEVRERTFSCISRECFNESIALLIKTDTPFMVCRFGSTEFENFSYEYSMKKPIIKRYQWFVRGYLSVHRRSSVYEKEILNRLCECSGFFPNSYDLMPRYTELVLSDMKGIDILGVWRQEKLFSKQLSNCKFVAMEDLEPYDYSKPWSKTLKGKKVLVIHPFEKSIRTQYAKRELLWDNPDVLPDFELKTIKAVQSIAGEEVPFKDWFEALDYMKSQMDAIEYDVAIIGCGAYGFHLAAHAKRTGHKAIHLGGATQILFGIKGKRWDNLPAISKFYNEHWVYPLPEETPRYNAKVEGGCYW